MVAASAPAPVPIESGEAEITATLRATWQLR
jgi:hypothetical protein